MKRNKVGKTFIILGLGLLLTSCATVEKNSKQVTNTEKTEQKKAPAKSKNESSTKASSEDEIEEIIETENGTFSVSLPDGWVEIDPTELNDDADVGLEHEDKMMYVAVLSESKEDYDGFEGFKEVTEFPVEVEEETEKPIDLNGWKGTRRLMTAKMDGLRFYYVYDLVESDAGHYAQRMAWTMNSKKKKYGKELENMLDSIKDVTN
ncbi:hypothetical protein A5821_000747 [Enterococcus sp. 7F3_DIV0205]|uniref:Lipoprotein n=1 Tax=Candidatus Enterococcus palustris TaxID=1834189 RepID=A0AAQ3W909_9ENTE|nr:hypothetical protein [Enterococcus sp. 7F3_DIV0205]OTN85162.1 hypothetical protein A5821_001091 [Enterococcus sp. 7F3_DIV0205]